MRAGLIGCGYWGKKLIRNFYNSQEFSLIKVADINIDQLQEINNLFSGIITTSNSDDVLNDVSIEAIIISTPVKSHFDFAKKALINGKHVLIEKPMTASFQEAKELVYLAEKHNRNLTVDYTFLYSGAVRKIKETLYLDNQLDPVRSIHSSRLGKGIIRDDVSVFWDLTSHDLSIANYLLDMQPISVKGEINLIEGDISKEKAVLTLLYPNQIEARFESTWYSDTKERQITIKTANKVIHFDDTLNENKLQILQKEITSYPKYNESETLSILVSDFFNNIKNNTNSPTNGKFALRVIKVLEAAHISLQNNGEPIKIQSEPNTINV
jgi:predicted dehydrogenase